MQRRGRVSAVIVWVLALVLAGAAQAHDFWLEPSTFTPEAEAVRVRLRVGEGFRGDALPRNPAWLRRFSALGRQGERPVEGRRGAEPAGSFFAGRDQGTLVVALESEPSQIELDAATFDRALEAEGLAILRTARALVGNVGSARDAFSRHAKALLHTPGGPLDGGDRAVGLELELVAERNPYAMQGGGTLPLRLQLRGSPLADAPVRVRSRSRPDDAMQGVTDAAGRVRFALVEGEWLVTSVHVEPVAASHSEYRSYWASLVFKISVGAGSPSGGSESGRNRNRASAPRRRVRERSQRSMRPSSSLRRFRRAGAAPTTGGRVPPIPGPRWCWPG